MDTPTAISMPLEQNNSLSETVRREKTKLQNFIRSRVPDPGDAEDILQEVFYELVESYRLPQPIENIGAWLYRVARNRITDLFRKRKPEFLEDALPVTNENGEGLTLDELLPSPDAGPEAAYARSVLLEEIEDALDELPEEQRQVFVAQEIDGRTFRELAAETGVSISTLISRKRYAVLHLRKRLQEVYDELTKR
jgi:RNA polymerase sigma factor (sigma-70 family)